MQLFPPVQQVLENQTSLFLAPSRKKLKLKLNGQNEKLLKHTDQAPDNTRAFHSEPARRVPHDPCCSHMGCCNRSLSICQTLHLRKTPRSHAPRAQRGTMREATIGHHCSTSRLETSLARKGKILSSEICLLVWQG